MTEVETSRSDVEAAFDSLAGESDTGAQEAPVAAEAPPAAVEATPATEEAAPPESPTSQSRTRDGTGRFARPTKTDAQTATKPPVKPATDGTQAAAATKPNATPTPKPGAETATQLKAPQSWKATAREEWAKVPTSVQAEIDKRERETARALQESARERQSWGQFQQVVSPYVGMIQAEGGDVMGTVQSLLQTAAALRTAPPAHKARLVAGIVKSYGIPIEALDAELAGQPVPQASHQAAVDPAQLEQRITQQLMQRFGAQRQQAMESKAATELQAFESSNPEFLPDVREAMADIMEVAARRGLQISYKDAYHRACLLDPEISQVLKQRDAAQLANANQASTQRAIRASSSVKSQPATSVSGEGPMSRREEIEAAFSKLSGR